MISLPFPHTQRLTALLELLNNLNTNTMQVLPFHNPMMMEPLSTFELQIGTIFKGINMGSSESRTVVGVM